MSADPQKYETGIEVAHLDSTYTSHEMPDMKTPNGGDHDVELDYPEMLKNMPDAPSMELLRDAARITHEDQRRNVGASLRKYGRICLMTVPYLLACIGQGYDGGAAGITASMPAFLIKFGEFNPVTKSLNVPSLWLSLWTGITQLGIAIGAFSSGPLLESIGPKVSLASTRDSTSSHYYR
jgi:hypothetical protein